jgi:hypothetical protein
VLKKKKTTKKKKIMGHQTVPKMPDAAAACYSVPRCLACVNNLLRGGRFRDGARS